MSVDCHNVGVTEGTLCQRFQENPGVQAQNREIISFEKNQKRFKKIQDANQKTRDAESQRFEEL